MPDASQHLPFAKQGAKAPVGIHPALIECPVCLLFRDIVKVALMPSISFSI